MIYAQISNEHQSGADWLVTLCGLLVLCIVKYLCELYEYCLCIQVFSIRITVLAALSACVCMRYLRDGKTNMMRE